MVKANDWNMLPSRGFMRVAGVLPSAELRLTGARVRDRSWGRVAASRGDGRERRGGDGGDGRAGPVHRRQRRVDTRAAGAAPEEVANATGSRGGHDDDDAEVDAGLPDWVEVRVEGQVVTPPVPVWLSRRISLRVRASRTTWWRAGWWSSRDAIVGGHRHLRGRVHRDPRSRPRSPGRPRIRSIPGWIRRPSTRKKRPWAPSAFAPSRPHATSSSSRTAAPPTRRPIERPRRRSDHEDLVGAYVPSSSGGQSSDGFGVPVSGLGDGVTCEVTMLADEGVDAEARAKRWLGAGSRSSASLGESSGGESSGVVPGWAALLVNGNRKRCRTRRGRRHARRGHRRAGERRRRSRGGARVPPRRRYRREDGDGLRRGARGVRGGEERRIRLLLPAIRLPPPHFPVPDPILEPRRSRQRRRRRRRSIPRPPRRVGRRANVQPKRAAATRASGQTRLRPNQLDDVLGRVPQRVRRPSGVPRRRRRREEGRDVVFVVDASDAVGRALFDEHVLESLKTMFCASHGGRSRRRR